MNKRTIRTLALAFGLTGVFAISALNASTFYSKKVVIPFDFKVGKISLGAGEYRVYQEFGKDFAFVENLKTGHRVQMMRPGGDERRGDAILRFETQDGERILKKVW